MTVQDSAAEPKSFITQCFGSRLSSQPLHEFGAEAVGMKTRSFQSRILSALPSRLNKETLTILRGNDLR